MASAAKARARARDLVDARGHAQLRPARDDRMPTLQGKYKVPHFDAKGEADHSSPTPACRRPSSSRRSTGRTSSTSAWARQRGADGKLGSRCRSATQVRASPRKTSASARTASSRRGDGRRPEGRRRRRAPHRRRDGRGDSRKALGERGALQRGDARRYRGFGFPGADDLGNMFQFYRDFEQEYADTRDVAASRALNPKLQTFDSWLAANVSRIRSPSGRMHPAGRVRTVRARPRDHTRPHAPPKGVGDPRRPPCAGSRIDRFHGGVATLTTAAACRDGRWRARGDTGGQRARACRRNARSGGSTAAPCASARMRRASHGRPGACAFPPSTQADGRVVVGGARAGAMVLARFNVNGTLDTTYGTNGFVTGPLRRDADDLAGRVRLPRRSRSTRPETCSRPASADRSRCSSRASRRRAR